jgi:glycosyltransferase involved in cell wall biosynthesis
MDCKSNIIYVLHDYGENSHYLALDKNCKVEYYEISFIKFFIKALIKRDLKLFNKQILNFKFFMSLIFTKNKKIILGLAPFDYRLLIVSLFLKKHKIYYHTSWPYWNGDIFPKKKFVNKFVINFWRKFLKRIFYIVTVTNYANKEIKISLKINNVKTVYHSFDENFFYYKNLQRDIDFLYVGRLVKEKGIEELLEIFKNRKENLYIVGDGYLKNLVKDYSVKFKNIIYLGKKNKKNLSELYNRAKFLILNSKKTSSWEELFGIVLIEAMACGCIPIAVNHVGPREIIVSNTGILFKENELSKVLSNINYYLEKENIYRNNAIKRAKFFNSLNIFQLWKEIL